MSINQLHQEVESLIVNSGMKPDVRMRCSIMRALKMRHSDLDAALTRSVIEATIKEMA
jgi:hypothetical protein